MGSQRTYNAFLKVYKECFTPFNAFAESHFRHLPPFAHYPESKKSQQIRDFHQKLLNRIVIIYFLQQKGWMGVPQNQIHWRGGHPHFLSTWFQQVASKQNFYTCFLEPLFYHTLSVQRPQSFCILTQTRIPCVPSGFFEPETTEVQGILPYDNHLFQTVFDHFDRCSFALAENSQNENNRAVDPAVLGYIFEHLLDDNKGHGTFYTPREIVAFMCQKAVIQYLKAHLGNQSEIEQFVYHVTQDQQKKPHPPIDVSPFIQAHIPPIKMLLDAIKVLDPAMGSGAFAIGMLDVLSQLKQSLMPTSDPIEVKRNIIEGSLYGVDIEPRAIDITKTRLWLSLVAEAVQPVPELYTSNHMREGNLLTESLPTEQNTFDIIIGNPPYIGEKGHRNIFQSIKLGPLAPFYQGKMDLFYFFFHLALNITREKGIVCFITTNYYPTATGAVKLRRDLKERATIHQLIDLNTSKIFSTALGQHNMIALFSKGYCQEAMALNIAVQASTAISLQHLLSLLKYPQSSKHLCCCLVQQDQLYDGPDHQLRLSGRASHTTSGSPQNILLKIQQSSQLLGSLCHIRQGIVTGADKVSIHHQTKWDLTAENGAGIFILTPQEKAALSLSNKDEATLKPWYKNSDIQRWVPSRETKAHLIYLKRSLTELSPALETHLADFKPILMQRREVQNGLIPWWQLQWPREQKMFEGPKIVVPQRSKLNTFAYCEYPWYASADVYFITAQSAQVDLKYILALLNSKVYYCWLYHRGKRKGEALELYHQPLSEIPIPVISFERQQVFVQAVEQILKKRESAPLAPIAHLETHLDALVAHLHDLTVDEYQWLLNACSQGLPDLAKM